MSLLDTVRLAVKIADTVTKPLQAVVTLQHVTASDSTGPSAFSAVTGLQAVVDYRQQQERTSSGIVKSVRPVVIFLDVVALLAATNNEGLSNDDIIVLPDGKTGPIIQIAGFIDAGTGKPVATEATLG